MELASFNTVSLITSLVAALLLPIAARAEGDAERENLARIEHELTLLKDMVAQASKDAEPNERVRFDYDYLLKDLELVRRGIEDHLDAPRQPRPISALSGQYRH